MPQSGRRVGLRQGALTFRLLVPANVNTNRPKLHHFSSVPLSITQSQCLDLDSFVGWPWSWFPRNDGSVRFRCSYCGVLLLEGAWHCNWFDLSLSKRRAECPRRPEARILSNHNRLAAGSSVSRRACTTEVHNHRVTSRVSERERAQAVKIG